MFLIYLCFDSKPDLEEILIEKDIFNKENIFNIFRHLCGMHILVLLCGKSSN